MLLHWEMDYLLGVDMVSSILDKKRVIILLSDGIHNSGLVTPEQATQYAILNNVQVHTIELVQKNRFIFEMIYTVNHNLPN